MLNVSEAINLSRGRTLEHVRLRNADGTPKRCRVNGRCKTWKTRDGFQLPVKHGLNDCFYITEENANQWMVV